MRLLTTTVLIALSSYAIADVFPQGDQGYTCQTTGGFFDFSPDGAIAACRQEIDEFCKSKGAPPVIGKITGAPSGPARFAKAEISFQCMTEADAALKKKEIVEAKNQQVRAEIENSKRMCQQDFGFIPNTPEFSNCLLELQKQNFENRRIEQGIAAQKELSEAQLAQQRQSESDQATMNAMQSINRSLAAPPVLSAPSAIQTSPSRVETDCTTHGSQTSCTTKRSGF